GGAVRGLRRALRGVPGPAGQPIPDRDLGPVPRAGVHSGCGRPRVPVRAWAPAVLTGGLALLAALRLRVLRGFRAGRERGLVLPGAARRAPHHQLRRSGRPRAIRGHHEHAGDGAREQHRSIWIGLGQLALFLALFAAWWPAWRLTGAVLAYGLSLLASHSGLLLAARRNVPLDLSALHEYFKFAAVVTVSAAVSTQLPMAPAVAAALWIAALAGFLGWARYRPAEY